MHRYQLVCRTSPVYINATSHLVCTILSLQPTLSTAEMEVKVTMRLICERKKSVACVETPTMLDQVNRERVLRPVRYRVMSQDDG